MKIDPNDLKGDRVLELFERGIEREAIAQRLGIRRGQISNFLADARRRRDEKQREGVE